MGYIVTSLSALYEFKIIAYKPKSLYVELPLGTNTTNYSDKYKISIQNRTTINVGTTTINDQVYYCPERLFIELDRFPLDEPLFNQALKNLEQIITPEKVLSIYKKIKGKRRRLNKDRIESYLSKNLINVYDPLTDQNQLDKELVIREYIMALLSKDDTPTSLVKGGSAIELYLSFKRSTNDIDTNIDLSDLNKLLNSLKNRYNPIYFEVLNEDEVKKKISDNKNNIYLLLKPKTLKRLQNFKEILNNINEIKLTLNGTYSRQELNEIISEFQITKRVLKIVKSHALVFSIEMLVAEKYQSLISKNKNSTRTKDLVDLYFLITQSKDFNYDKFFKWFFRKWENSSRDPKNKDEVIEYIKDNKDIELTKIKDNFNKVLEFYEIKIDYEKALEIYENISIAILDKFSIK